MILKILLILGLILAVWFIFFKKSAPLTKERRTKHHKNSDDTMVECSTCSVYVSIDEAIVSSGKYYCSQECLKA